LTINELIKIASRYPEWVTAYFILPPLIAWLITLLIRSTDSINGLTKIIFSSIIYAVSIPGLLSILLVGYSLFIGGQSLLQVNFLIYFLPVISMVFSILLIKRKVDLDILPGFDRLSGLMSIMLITFIIIIIIYKTRIFIGFISSFQSFVVVGIILFIILKIASKKFLK
jgi:hypothetical protein